MSMLHPEVGLIIAKRYELTGPLASGGMGEVWRGRDTLLDRPVAVKLLRREYVEQESFRLRFRAEARHAAKTVHPNIAHIFDYGESEQGAYLVMELVPGEPLSAKLQRESILPPLIVANLITQAAEGLTAAHESGLVHRDVKPGNLLITPTGTLKITDFGIARAGAEVPLTKTGEVMGTAQYLSPEQAQGEIATEASDIYSLGIVAYEALSGKRPFDAESQVATALAHIRQEVPPLPSTVPSPVAQVVLSALAKSPQDRPASAVEFARKLAAAVALPAAPNAPQATDHFARIGKLKSGALAATTTVLRPKSIGPAMGLTSALLLATLLFGALMIPGGAKSDIPNRRPGLPTQTPTTEAGNPGGQPDAFQRLPTGAGTRPVGSVSATGSVTPGTPTASSTLTATPSGAVPTDTGAPTSSPPTPTLRPTIGPTTTPTEPDPTEPPSSSPSNSGTPTSTSSVSPSMPEISP